MTANGANVFEFQEALASDGVSVEDWLDGSYGLMLELFETGTVSFGDFKISLVIERK